MSHLHGQAVSAPPILLTIAGFDPSCGAGVCADLKKMVRTGLEHAFMPGSSLWAERDGFSRAVGACANEPLGGEHPSNRCAEFLQANQKARQQWELERRFQVFEAKL